MPKAPATKLQPGSPERASTRWTGTPAALALVVAVAVATRIVTFGNPLVIVGDQFYHYVGHAMLGGQWPYIDIWDRKPIGLFLIFAALAAVSNGSVLVMQLVATGFAITAWVIRHIALHFAGPGGALLAALPISSCCPCSAARAASRRHSTTCCSPAPQHC